MLGSLGRWFSSSPSLRGGAAARAFVFDVNKGISACTSFRQLESLLYTLDRRALGQPGVLSHAVERMGKLRSIERNITDDYVGKSKVVASLLELLSSSTEDNNSNHARILNLPAVIQALATGRLIGSHPVPNKLVTQFVGDLPVLRPQQLASCLYGFAQLSSPVSSTELSTVVMPAVEAALLQETRLENFSSQQLVQLAWSCARLGSTTTTTDSDSRLMGEIALQLLDRGEADWSHALSLSELLQLVWAYDHHHRASSSFSKLLFPSIKLDLLTKRGGWSAIKSTNTLAATVCALEPALAQQDVIGAAREFTHNSRALSEVDSLLLLVKLVHAFAKRSVAPPASPFYARAATELVNRHLKGLDFDAIVGLLAVYSQLGSFDGGLVDKACKELVKPRVWKPQPQDGSSSSSHVKLMVALAVAPPSVLALPHVSAVVNRLTLVPKGDDEEQRALAAWALACLASSSSSSSSMLAALSKEEKDVLLMSLVDARRRQELAWSLGANDDDAAPSSAPLPAQVRQRLQAEFPGEVVEEAGSSRFGDLHLPQRNVVIETSPHYFDCTGAVLRQSGVFRRELLLQHANKRCFFLAPPTPSASRRAQLDALVLAIKDDIE